MKLHPSIKSIKFVLTTPPCENLSFAFCEAFALCENPATITIEHPILGNYKSCKSCDAKLSGNELSEKPRAFHACKTCGDSMTGYPAFVNECDNCHCP
jgi:hypothetical protein